MLAAYIFCLVTGGGLLLLSLLGDVLGDAGGDLGVDASADVHFELDHGGVDAGTFDTGTGDVDVHGDSGDQLHASKILSIRTLTYTLFGFGAVGTLLSLVGSSGFLTTLAFAVTGGLLSGALVTTVFDYLRATDTGAQVSDDTFVGLSGTVTLPLSATTAGAVAVQRGQRRITLRALPHPSVGDADPAGWKSVVVVEMDRGVARVAPVGEDLSLEP